MVDYKTHFTALKKTADASPLLPVLKIPQLLSGGELQRWKDITYSQFLCDVERLAKYWSYELLENGIEAGSVIGLWLKGTTYLDLLHIWGISRAGYVPQLISAYLTSNVVVRELLSEAEAKGLIHDTAVTASVGGNISVFPTVDFLGLAVDQYPLAESKNPTSGEDVVFILHSSGSTSGKPKLVPVTARWLDCNIRKTQHFTFRSPGATYQETVVASGSFCHVASTLVFVSYVAQGGCMALPTSIPYSLPELRRIVSECKVTVLNMFSSFLCGVIKEARNDPKLLAILQSFDACTCGGLPLDETEEAWAREQNINIVEIFASTEVGCMLISVEGREGNLLRLWPESAFEMRPIPVAPDDTIDGAPNNATNGASSRKLVELVVPRYAPDCPHFSLCDEKTGDFFTGDVFLQVEPDRYISKGRNDDWIKMEISLRCDTRSIERNALETCGKDLISAAVVIGAARPSPALLVETKQIEGHDELRAEILRRIAPFHERRYKHERILDSRLIIVVPDGALPRTPKGSIQRKVVEREFGKELDRIYAEVYPRT